MYSVVLSNGEIDVRCTYDMLVTCHKSNPEATCYTKRPLGARTAAVNLESFYAQERPDEENRTSWVGVKRRMPAHSNLLA